MSTNNPNMDNIQNSPQFQEAVKNAVDKALSDLLANLEVEEEEKPQTQGCPYLRPVSPPVWKTCTERDLANPNKEKCLPPFWLMSRYFENQQCPCCCDQQQCSRRWNPPCRNFDGPGRFYENNNCQERPREWRPWWSNRNADNHQQAPREWGPPWWSNRNADNNQQAPREWGPPWWSSRNADGAGSHQQAPKEWGPWGSNRNPANTQQAPKDWGPWWSNRNADNPGNTQQAPKEWVPWWSSRNADSAGNPQPTPKEWRSWWFNRNSDESGRPGDNNNNSSSFWR